MLHQLISDRWYSPAHEQFSLIENEFNVRLPPEFKDLYHACNGGNFSQWLERPRIPLAQTPSTMLSIGRTSMPWIDLLDYMRVHKGRIPNNRVPFATAGDNHYQLNLENGGVELWVRDQELEKPAEANASPVCRCLQDFVNSLRVKSLKDRINDPWLEDEPLLEVYATVNDVMGFSEQLLSSDCNEQLLCELMGIACKQHSTAVCYVIIDALFAISHWKWIGRTEFHGSVDSVVRVLELGAPQSELQQECHSGTAQATAAAWIERKNSGLAW